MSIPLWQKAIGGLLYLLPWSKTLPFGNILFNSYPSLKLLIIPTLPILFVERLIPFGSLILFLGLFLGIVRNQNIPYFIRFNALQSILLNISIIIITFGFQIFLNPYGSIVFVDIISAFIFILILSIIIFSIYESLRGKEADLPLISNAVRIQL